MLDAHLVGRTNHAIIQRALWEKEGRWKDRMEMANISWLLLACDASVQSSALRLHESVGSETYQSSFQRAFVLDCTDRRFAELCLRNDDRRPHR